MRISDWSSDVCSSDLLEFLPSAYMRKTFMADGKPGGFPLYPASAMERTPERNAASGRSDGPGAEPLPIAEGGRFVLAPDDPARRVTVRSDGDRKSTRLNSSH